jgi:hypothetical protein
MRTATISQEQSELYWLIPSAIDLPKIIEQQPPKFRYKIDYFYHLIDTICNQMEYLDPADKLKWVRLSALGLQKFNKHYDRYLDYLEEVGIIEINKQYIVGKQTRGY